MADRRKSPADKPFRPHRSAAQGVAQWVAQRAKTKTDAPKKWTKARVERYKAWLRARAARRWQKGKRKSSAVLVRKYIEARRIVQPGFMPRLADTPSAGHHAPPLALSNKHGGVFAFGARGSAAERARTRLYFQGTADQRREAHWLAHASEDMQGLNRQGTFTGSDGDLAAREAAAHHRLQLLDGTQINVEARAQDAAPTGTQKPIGDATRLIVEAQMGQGQTVPQITDDNADSGVDDGFEDLGSDSDEWSSDSDDDGS
ncbi:MAG: hypothetical protein AAF330_06005 [Pseudomonadota bacterium]